MKFYSLFQFRIRNVFTRSNRLRFRYVLGCAGLAVLLFTTVFNQQSTTAALLDSTALRFASTVDEAMQYGPFSPDDPESIGGNDGENFEFSVASILKPYSNDADNSSADDSKAALKPSNPLHIKASLGKGDTVAGVLQDKGVDGEDVYEVVQALADHFDLRTVRPGQEFEITFKEVDGAKRLSRFVMPLDHVKSVAVSRNKEGGYVSSVEEKELIKKQYAGEAVIRNSLYGSALQAGIPEPVIARLIHMYSWSVDFQRDIRKDDRIEVLYEAYETPDGHMVKLGNIEFASLNVNGSTLPLYRYEDDGGTTDYYDEKGHSAKKTLMTTPVDGARISSGFGMRRHPVLGYNKMHKGMDFAAPLGTPIYAAGDGVIERMNRFGGYGNYVRIRHNSELKTAYAHVHKFAKGLSAGSRVKQGQVIAYIGTSGRSTGPHLHYEVLLNDKQVNPKRIDLPVGHKLKGKDLDMFMARKAKYQKLYAELSGHDEFASLQIEHEPSNLPKKKPS